MSVKMEASSSIMRVKTNENIQVYLRVRPMNERERFMRSQEAVEVTSNREVVVKQDYRSSKKFTFDRSFGKESNQASVYQAVVAPLIEEVLAGYNCTVFAYGQTGTGKTHTMIGNECPNVGNSWDDNSDLGIIPRAVDHLFEELRIMGVEFSMRISFLELYNEELSDLLSVSDTVPIKIYDDNSKKGSIIVHGLEELPVHSTSDVYKLLAKGQEKRKTASTLMNVQSSRSHTIFSILVHIREYNADGEEMLKVGKLNLVDLAGSENISKAGNEKGIRTRETVNINQSLLTLGRVITALVERTPHIPYRESKLTRLLQESLGGRTKTSIIATVSPGHKDLEETLSTLEYAHRAKNIQNKPEINQKLTKKLALKEYTEEIDRLKRDLMASRSKNGIYLAEETYADMTSRLEAQNKELGEKQSTIKVMKDEMAKIQNVFNEVSLNLVEKEAELVETYETLHSTKTKLGHTVKALRNTNKKYQEKKEILLSHVQTEEVLSSQAREVKSVADIASNDTYLLHDAIERRKLTDIGITAVCESFENTMNSNINEMSSDIDNFNSAMQNEMRNMVEHIEVSNARNNEFSATILDKLAQHKSNSEANTENVKKLLQEKLNQEMDFTSEQLKLVESVFKQVIEENRKFNNNLANETLTSLLSVVNEQSVQSIVKNELIREMVDNQRKTIRNFCSGQISRIETHSVDVSKVIQNCQTTIETGLKKSDTLVESISKMLNDLQANNNNMKSVAPILSQAIETVNFATKCQIDETNKANLDSELYSEELKRELFADSNDIKQRKDENQSKISSIIDLINKHSALFGASLKSSKNKIRQQFEQQKNVATQAIGKVETQSVGSAEQIRSSVTAIATDIQSENSRFQESATRNLTLKANLSTIVDQFSDSTKKKFGNWRNMVNNFSKNEIKTYSSSGSTPAKREFSYPKLFAETSPHNRIIRRFWETHNESELNVSMAISEEEETSFMDGFTTVQSSSMVQTEPVPTSEVYDIQMQSPMTHTSTFVEHPISDRVLSEIYIKNYPISSLAKVPPGQLDHEYCKVQMRDNTTTAVEPNDSNKEN